MLGKKSEPKIDKVGKYLAEQLQTFKDNEYVPLRVFLPGKIFLHAHAEETPPKTFRWREETTLADTFATGKDELLEFKKFLLIRFSEMRHWRRSANNAALAGAGADPYIPLPSTPVTPDIRHRTFDKPFDCLGEIHESAWIRLFNHSSSHHRQEHADYDPTANNGDPPNPPGQSQYFHEHWNGLYFSIFLPPDAYYSPFCPALPLNEANAQSRYLQLLPIPPCAPASINRDGTARCLLTPTFSYFAFDKNCRRINAIHLHCLDKNGIEMETGNYGKHKPSTFSQLAVSTTDDPDNHLFHHHFALDLAVFDPMDPRDDIRKHLHFFASGQNHRFDAQDQIKHFPQGARDFLGQLSSQEGRCALRDIRRQCLPWIHQSGLPTRNPQDADAILEKWTAAQVFVKWITPFDQGVAPRYPSVTGTTSGDVQVYYSIRSQIGYKRFLEAEINEMTKKLMLATRKRERIPLYVIPWRRPQAEKKEDRKTRLPFQKARVKAELLATGDNKKLTDYKIKLEAELIEVDKTANLDLLWSRLS